MAAKGLFINSTEQGFTVKGVNNNFFPDNATLAYPANSVILITDESDMATFRSASNYDVLFSALIKDININGEQVTKDSIIETFNEAANKPMSNPDSFTSVEYDGKNDLIFYNDKGEEVAKVDVTPFIKDGMIEDVEISEGNLVIHFNTDSEIKDIYIPLTEIFDPNQYYTKTEIDSKVDDIWNTIDTKEEVISTALNALNEDVENLSNNKADASALTAHIGNTNVHFSDGQKSKYDGFEGQYYNEDHWDIMPQSAFNDFTNDYSTAMGQFDQRITANENAIGTKANASEVYSKTESDAKYATQVVVNEEIAARIEAIRDVNTALEGKADKTDTYTKTETDNAIATAMEDIDLSDYVDVTTFNKKELATAKALTQLNENKADKTEIPDVSTFATKTEVNTALSAKADKSDTYTKAQTDAAIQTAVGQIDLSDYVEKDDFDTKEEVISTALNNLAANKQDTLTAGTGISIQNNVISATGGGGGEQQQADWTESDTTDPSYIQHKPTLATVATSGDYDDLSNKPTIPVVPTNVSAFTNDSNFVKGGGDIVSIVKISQSDYDALVSPDPYTLYIITSNV